MSEILQAITQPSVLAVLSSAMLVMRLTLIQMKHRPHSSPVVVRRDHTLRKRVRH